ncbi:MAG: carbohydrate ABC transporter permease [Treponema sp.]|nr:carbohydrate ABC transporter permease [Treponema sp.]
MAKKQSIISVVLIYIILGIVFCFTIFPVFYTFMGSFKSSGEVLTSGSKILPERFAFENYVRAWNLANFRQYTFNSFFIAIFSVAGVIIISLVAGYVFARGYFPGKQFFYYLVLSSMFVSLGSLTLYPLLMIMKVVRLNQSLWGVILIHIFAMNATNLFITRSYIESIPREIDEASKIDGCSFYQIFYHVIAPLCTPVIATIGILSFRSSWNDYLLPMVFTMGTPKRIPLIVGVVNLRSSGEAASSWNLMLAGTSLSIIPMIIIYLCFNRYFIDGLTSGSVKG